MTKEQIIIQITSAAEKAKLDPAIVYGVCVKESSLDPMAVRFEENYRWLFHPDLIRPTFCSLDTEKCLQKFSFGLMQVMGATFRELGFRGWLTSIPQDIGVQLEYGCKYLQQKIKKYGRDEGILAYNAGSPRKSKVPGKKYVNDSYLSEVLEYAREYISREAGGHE
ncbi:MAG: lytic transglycosylase domain-containing protein [Deltaproteobacteria bacterium]|nr:lytic transglycosylase domain-containing protein [Deltaproteobacteria bacterium]